MPQQMTDLGPKSDEELAKVALDLAQYGFGDVRSLAVVEGEHLHVRVGIIGPEGFVELGVALYGDEVEAAKFAANTDPVTGKIATVVQFRKDSAAAVLDGDVVFSDDDARTWKGGVYHVARVRLADGTWRSWEFACAASGVRRERRAELVRRDGRPQRPRQTGRVLGTARARKELGGGQRRRQARARRRLTPAACGASPDPVGVRRTGVKKLTTN